MAKFEGEGFTYSIDGKPVKSMGEFYFGIQGGKYTLHINGLHTNAVSNHLKYVSTPIDRELNKPFFLDETLFSDSFPTRNKDKTEEEILNEIRSYANKNNNSLSFNDLVKIVTAESEEELEDILKRSMSIGAPDWNQNNTSCSIYERVQDSSISAVAPTFSQKEFEENLRKAEAHFNQDSLPAYSLVIENCNKVQENYLTSILKRKEDNKNSYGEKIDLPEFPKQFYDTERKDKHIKKAEKYLESLEIGKKESKTVEKVPVFTYCKQMKNAVEALALRSLYGHNKYEKGDDWENFSRVENGEFEYANASFRHALGIGEEDEKNHLIAEAWNSVAKLEIYLRKNK